MRNVCHIDFSLLGIIRRKLRATTLVTKLTAYKALERPVQNTLALCEDNILSPYQACLTAKIERVQRLVVTFIFYNYSRKCNNRFILNDVESQPFEARSSIATVRFFYSLSHGETNITRDDYLKPSFSIRGGTIQDKGIGHFLYSNNILNLLPCVMKEWNPLHDSMVNSASNESFAKSLASLPQICSVLTVWVRDAACYDAVKCFR